jgi:hypothetical protein
MINILDRCAAIAARLVVRVVAFWPVASYSLDDRVAIV